MGSPSKGVVKQRSQGLTDRQRKFAEGIVAGKRMAEAYKEAYNCENMSTPTVSRAAVTLMKNSKVVALIEEMRRPIVIAEHLTAEGHMLELRRLRDLALDAGKHEAAIRAEELRGKVAGLYITKVESGAPGAFQALDAQAKMTAIEAIKAELDRRAALTHDTNVTDVTPK